MKGVDEMGFLSLAEKGRNDWWRYLLSIMVIIGVGHILGRKIVSVLIPVIFRHAGHSVSHYVLFVVYHLPFLLLLASVWFSIRVIHKRSLMTLITTNSKINWKRYFYGFGVMVLVYFVWNLLDYFLLHINSYHYLLPQWGIEHFLVMALLCLLIIPFQSAMEELLFRGYVLQATGRWIKNWTVLSVVNGLLFASIHTHIFKIELFSSMMTAFLATFLFGVLATMITLKSQSIELASGIHCANNLLVFIIASKSDRMMTSPLFGVDIRNDWINLSLGGLAFAVIYILVLRYLKNNKGTDELV